MGRAPCCDKVGLKKGRWTSEEDEILIRYITQNGEGSWRALPKNAGLLRCGKSCRLRWINYLRSDLKRGNFTSHEQDSIIKLHASFGNKWSLIANQLPGRTDNEIKNYWNSTLSRRIDAFFRRPEAAEFRPPQGLLTSSNNLAPAAAPAPASTSQVNYNGLVAAESSPAAAGSEAAVSAAKKRKGRTSRAAMNKKNKSRTNYKSDKPSSRDSHHQQVAKQDPYRESNKINGEQQLIGVTTTGSSSLASCHSRGNVRSTVATATCSPESTYLSQTPSLEKEACHPMSNYWTEDAMESLVWDSLLTCQNDEYYTPQSQRPAAAVANESVSLDASCELGVDDLAFDDGIAKFVEMNDDQCGALGSNDTKSSISSCNKGYEEMKMEPTLDSSKRGLLEDFSQQSSAGAPASVDLDHCAALAGADWDYYWDDMVQQDDSTTLWSCSSDEKELASDGKISWLWDYANQQDNSSNYRVDKKNQKDEEQRDAMVAWLLS